MSTSEIHVAPRSRLAGHIAQVVWEAVLLVLVVATVVFILVFTRAEISDMGGWLSWQLATIGLLATGFALSVRTATPNLAVGAMAAFAGAVYARLLDVVPGLLAVTVTVAAVTVIGLMLGVIIAATRVPAWAVSLAAMAALPATTFALVGSRGHVLPVDGRAGTALGAFLAVIFVLGSFAGGALFLVPKVRLARSANRRDAVDASRLPARLLGAVVGFGGSSLLAAVSGVAFGNITGAVFHASSFDHVLFVAGAVFLGGVSIIGGRGGVTGVVLATTLLVLIRALLQDFEVPGPVSTGLLAAVAILIGVVLSWVREKITVPEPVGT